MQVQTAWPSHEQDMLEAQSIVDKHICDNDGEPISMFEVRVHEKNKSVEVRAANWAIEIANYFTAKYGIELGRKVTQKILIKFLLQKVTVH